MEDTIRLETPLKDQDVKRLKAGMSAIISGLVYGARDAAHKRFMELIDAGKPLPFPVNGGVIYYVGPTPTPKGRVIGSAGPTTAVRMDKYTPDLSSLGLKGTIGKGERGVKVREAIMENGGVYFTATGGVGALLAHRHIKSAKAIAYEELGPEALWELQFVDFPVMVAIDSDGNDIFSSGKKKYAQ
jgi:fumarate hydratase subunit beta